VKLAISNQNWCDKRKANAVDAYTNFLEMLGLSWKPPKYKPTRKLPFIPKESEIDQLIAGCGRKTGTLLQLLKETGMRIGEAANLKWEDFDFEKRLVTITPEKGSNPRILPISRKLVSMLKTLQRINSGRVFCNSVDTLRRTFQKQRKRIAIKTQNPRLLKIHFHTLRHWKATMFYHKTKDIIKVKDLLGHVNINNTLIYLHLEKALFNSESDEFHVKAAKTSKEACKLVEVGFEYVCTTPDGFMIFRKRK